MSISFHLSFSSVRANLSIHIYVLVHRRIFVTSELGCSFVRSLSLALFGAAINQLFLFCSVIHLLSFHFVDRLRMVNQFEAYTRLFNFNLDQVSSDL